MSDENQNGAEKAFSSFAREKAAQAWCTSETESIDMDPRLADAFAQILEQYINALCWCGGCADFAPGGQAAKGWERVCRPLIS